MREDSKNKALPRGTNDPNDQENGSLNSNSSSESANVSPAILSEYLNNFEKKADQYIGEVDRTAHSVEDTIKQQRAKSEDSVRKYVTFGTLLFLGISICALFLSIVFDIGIPADKLDKIENLVQTMVYPIATLSLGYYFGASRG